MMANPQAENGHIDIANEIAEALMRTNLNSYQWRILWAIWRKTYGWHKKDDIIPVSQLCKATGIRHGHVSRTLKELELMNMITRTQLGTRQKVKIAFQKDHEKWKPVPNRVQVESRKLVLNEVHTRTQPGTKLVPNQEDSKEKKETIKRKGGNGVPHCPHQEIISLYHQILPEFSQVKAWTEERKKTLRARWRENKKYQDIGWWEGFFKHVRTSPFLMGENDRKWQPNLEWLIKKSNFVNVIEGKYHSQ
jgi:phage replication O-like protein O